MKIAAIRALQDYRKQHDTLVECATVTRMPARYGTFEAYGYRNPLSGEHHVALVKGEIRDGHNLLCRIHSECPTGGAFDSLRCDYGRQLAATMARTEQEGREVLLYTCQEDRSIGPLNKLRTYELQDQGIDILETSLALSFPGDLREYFVGVQILRDLGARTLRLLTNNPDKVYRLSGFSLDIKERMPIQMMPTNYNLFYLRTKGQRMGYLTHY